jgi:transcription initiation factor TFIID TATA-box-binding protein
MTAAKEFNIRIENIVASASFGVVISLEKVVSKLEGMEYEPEQFPGLVYRMKDPKAAALIFGSGKVVCTGARSVKDVGIAVAKVSKKLKSIGAMVKPKPVPVK